SGARERVMGSLSVGGHSSALAWPVAPWPMGPRFSSCADILKPPAQAPTRPVRPSIGSARARRAPHAGRPTVARNGLAERRPPVSAPSCGTTDLVRRRTRATMRALSLAILPLGLAAMERYGSAAPEERTETIHVDYAAPADCPSEEEFEARIHARTTRAVF